MGYFHFYSYTFTKRTMGPVFTKGLVLSTMVTMRLIVTMLIVIYYLQKSTVFGTIDSRNCKMYLFIGKTSVHICKLKFFYTHEVTLTMGQFYNGIMKDQY